MFLIYLVLFILGIAVVVKSADIFLNSVEKIGEFFNIPKFILGVVLVGFGTSLPELTTSLAAVLSGNQEVALGNILGSNVVNILIILGLATVFLGTVKFKKELTDVDIPLLMATTVLFAMMLVDGNLSRPEAILLLVGAAGYLLYTMFSSDREEYHKGMVNLAKAIFSSSKKSNTTNSKTKERLSWKVWVLMILSVIVLGFASNLAVENLLKIVEIIGIGVGIVSFFALAIGTSLPELVVTFKALKKGEGDMVVGNIIGSNMFNILMIGGISGVFAIQTLAMPTGLWMIAGAIISAGLLGMSVITKRLQIWEGGIFILVYAVLSLQLLA